MGIYAKLLDWLGEQGARRRPLPDFSGFEIRELDSEDRTARECNPPEDEPEKTVASKRYAESDDVFSLFIRDRCRTSPDVTVTKGRLYDEYAKWCRANGYAVASKRAFGMALMKKGFSDFVARGGTYRQPMRWWSGITVKAGVTGEA